MKVVELMAYDVIYEMVSWFVELWSFYLVKTDLREME